MRTRNMACIFTTMGKTGSNWLKPSNLVFRFSKASSFSALGRLCLADCGRQELVVLAATPMAIFSTILGLLCIVRRHGGGRFHVQKGLLRQIGLQFTPSKVPSLTSGRSSGRPSCSRSGSSSDAMSLRPRASTEPMMPGTPCNRAPATRPTMSAGISARRNSTNSSPSFKRQLAQSGEGRLADGSSGAPERDGYWCGSAEQADHHSKQLRDATEEQVLGGHSNQREEDDEREQRTAEASAGRRRAGARLPAVVRHARQHQQQQPDSDNACPVALAQVFVIDKAQQL